MTIRDVHRGVGLAAVVLFAGTGLYMHVRYDHLHGMSDTTRLLFRSTHIYLLFSGLLNLALGLHLATAAAALPRRLQQLGSVLVLLGPLLLLSAFLREPFLGGLARPFTSPAVYTTLVGMGLHWLASLATEPTGDGR
jgi:hypothetical protein